MSLSGIRIGRKKWINFHIGLERQYWAIFVLGGMVRLQLGFCIFRFLCCHGVWLRGFFIG